MHRALDLRARIRCGLGRLTSHVFSSDHHQTKAASRLQYFVRANLMKSTKLHRKNLVERILFEDSMLMGTIRLINQVMVFTFLLLALNSSSNQAAKAGIFKTLEATYDFAGTSSCAAKIEFTVECTGRMSLPQRRARVDQPHFAPRSLWVSVEVEDPHFHGFDEFKGLKLKACAIMYRSSGDIEPQRFLGHDGRGCQKFQAVFSPLWRILRQPGSRHAAAAGPYGDVHGAEAGV